jgi:membrane-bound serine protease (ClpP class)
MEDFTMQALYALLIDPNIIFLLFLLALMGIYIEISHPGLIFPGVIGAIALLFFLFGARSLAPNWAGLALMTLALVLLILDVRLLTRGFLAVGAALALVVGSLLFFNSGGSHQAAYVNVPLIYLAGALVAGLGFYVVSMIIRTRRTPVTTGPEGMIGAMVIALTDLKPEGRVNYGGEDWAAILDPPILTVSAGSELRVVSIEGLRLHVQLATHTLPPLNSLFIEGV